MSVKDRPADDPTVVARFVSYLRRGAWRTFAGAPCLLWTGGKSRGGNRWSERAYYGTFNPGGVVKGGVRAHVYAAWYYGIIPELRTPKGMNLDHRCHNSLCCNPLHLELVTPQVNQERRLARIADEERLLAFDRELELAMRKDGWVRVHEPGA